MTVHSGRIKQLQSTLHQNDLSAFIVTHNVDIYYLTGTMQSGLLIIPAFGQPTFYVRRSVTRAWQESAVPVEELGSMKTFGHRAGQRYPSISGAAVLGVTYDVLPVEWYDRLRAAFPDAKWHNASAIIREARMVKGQEELQAMRKAAGIADQALRHAVSSIRPGISEIELLAEIEYMLRKAGHLGLMRVRAMNMELVTGIAASGASAAIPSAFDGPAGGEGLHPAFPKGAGCSRIQPGEPILLDIGCNIEGYVTDQTRTAVIGELEEELQAAYDAAEAILARIEWELKPGIVCEELYAIAVDMAVQSGFGEHFMGYMGDAVKFVGHGIGLEIDEWPVLAKGFKTPLRPGMVIAVEPKFTFPGRGVVGIENTYAITESGFEKLTLTPHGLIRIT